MPETELEPPFQAYSGDSPFIFASYSHRDAAAVFPELRALHDSGYRVWFDEGIDPGNEWPEEIAKALHLASAFLVFISPDAVASRNVRNEIHLALHLNKDFLAVYLTDTQLPPGLQLSISSIQAILKYRMSPQSYRRKIAKALSDTLRESVNDDQLAWATFYSSDLNFEDDDLFYRAFVVRLEAFADLQDFSGAESGKTLSVGGMKVSFRVEQGKFKQITFEAQDWKEVSSQTRTAMLVYWEEYLSGLSLQALKKTKSAALVDRVLERTVRRWADLGLLEPVLNSRTDGLNDRWQQMTIPVVQELVENPGAPISKLLFEQIVTKKTVPGFNYPETETEWFAWQQAVIKAGQESLQRVADSFDMNSNKAKQSLVNADVPEFLLRHIRRKILAKDIFIMNFKDSLKGRPLEWARALLLEGG